MPSDRSAISEYDAAMLVGMDERRYAKAMDGRSAVSKGFDFIALIQIKSDLKNKKFPSTEVTFLGLRVKSGCSRFRTSGDLPEVYPRRRACHRGEARWSVALVACIHMVQPRLRHFPSERCVGASRRIVLTAEVAAFELDHVALRGQSRKSCKPPTLSAKA